MKISKHIYTTEQDEWLRENVEHCDSFAHLTEMFNEHFATNVSGSSVSQRCCKRLHIHRKAKNKHYYTAEQDEWLRRHIENCESFAHLAEMFNRHFNTNVGKYSVSDRCCKQLSIHRNTNSGIFKNGEQHAQSYEIGDERIHDGYVWVKVNDIKHCGKVTSKMFKENWVQKHRYVYERQYGKIPNDHIIIFLDSDKTNFAINNLYCIPRKINAIMNQNHWFSENPELTLTAIKWCELYYALKENTVS